MPLSNPDEGVLTNFKDNSNKTSLRVHFLDTLRGFALINMIVFHLMYDIVIIFGVKCPWYRSIGAYYWQQFICWSFILASGACVNLSRNKYKSGLTVLFCGFIISFITCVFMPEQAIPFGILSFMGFAILITQLIKPLFDKINAVLGVAISFLLFAFTRYLPCASVGFFSIKLWQIPDFFYKTNFLFAFGLPNGNYPMIDYFPLVPWVFLFWTGYFGFQLLNQSKVKNVLYFNITGLSFIGRHTLIIYMLHQPILYGISYLLLN